ncbi:helix-hairpin-helix domain-containing protein [uncultured Sulfitobacter sp.]|uniref:helix-hairpin-helix domain-containing protein n=1 Tax=uncultured Sulfitobacter sp. TaxID=191468 RepID=UPI0026316622|nr:helix-hairpin-helix domain-containing protein [uncultured Sulfitobacter sp.]
MEAPELSAKGRKENQFLAAKLREVADLLEQQAASPFRINAYRDAATFIATLSQPIRNIYMKYGKRGLEDLPTIGSSIAAAVAEFLDSGTLEILDRLRGSTDPEKLFQTVPMIGPALAREIHERLHIETLEALEAAVVDGRLETINGIGPRRCDSIRHALNDMLARRRPSPRSDATDAPAVADILSVDQLYRDTAQSLPLIKPRRFNETGERRIPVLHTERGQWEFTALYSNSAAAHKYNRTKDWVVIYFERTGHPEGQTTVITKHGGPLDGRRIVRGRESACAKFYGL